MKLSHLCATFAQLNALQVYQMLRLRSEVFVVEQKCVYQDIDNKDLHSQTRHLLWYQADDLVAYARVLPPSLSYDDPSLGRVLTAESIRGKGIGREIIQTSLDTLSTIWPNRAVTIGAQSHLSHLYQAFGFKEVSAHYPEDGIMHVDMTKT
ncbi:GNAT family N-acetyltransferase [Glaciecola sp. XM2]|uniref:GNAT family N-acetyltransferase n=1 Tax=Glaciecola sp. XM2 TaxID=1914931 RepID=UPI001BDE25FE|nr:GNAT family N-acetyltransferase [Glaciecola sp. XM2]MBT1450239.1 GNAT family N-acetyltransferase [Glaciecola sp. XM2]